MKQHSLFCRMHRIGLIAALVFPILTACGGGSGSSVDIPARPITVSLLAGYPLGEGNQDGPTSTTASFSNLVQGMALTSSGEVVIADTNNHLIRKLSADYQTVTTLAGSRLPVSTGTDATTHYSDGSGPDARFYQPAAVAVDAAGNTYVADSGNHLVRKISPAGVVTTLAGQPGVCGNQDGIGNAASLCNPIGIASSKTGLVYVLERFPDTGKRQLRKITPEGRVNTLDLNLQDRWVTALATDSAGTLIFAELGIGFSSNRLLRYDANAQVTVVADMSGFGAISNLAFDASDRPIAIVEYMGSLLGSDSRISLVRIGDDGIGTTLFTQFCGFGRFGLFGSSPLVAKADGQFLVALRGCFEDQPYLQLRSYTQQGTYTVVAGPISPIGTRDGQGDAARFDQLSSLASDASGMLYVRDYSNTTRSSVIRTVQADGQVRTLGQGGSCTSLAGLSQEFMQIGGPMAADDAGSIYRLGQRGILKMKDCKVELLVDLHAFFLSNSVDGVVTGLATDTSGNIYLSTSGGVILKLDTDRQLTLFAGSATQYGHRDGQGQAARFAMLGSMTIDADGNLYVIDGPPPSSLPAWRDIPTLGPVIRKITPDGFVSTLAGNPNAAPGHADGLGTDARFSMHYNWFISASLAVDSKGNLYVSDPENSVIRKVTPEGRVSTPIGQVGQRGFAAAEMPASISRPASIAIRDSKLYIAVPHAVLQAKLPD